MSFIFTISYQCKLLLCINHLARNTVEVKMNPKLGQYAWEVSQGKYTLASNEQSWARDNFAAQRDNAISYYGQGFSDMQKKKTF